MSAGERAAEDLPPGTPVLIYARLPAAPHAPDAPDGAADDLADLVRWCHRRRLTVRGAYLDVPGGQVWDGVMNALRRAAATAILVPALDHLGANPADRLQAVAAAGAVVAVTPSWERLVGGNRISGTVFGSTVQARSLHGPVRVIINLPTVPPPPRLLPPPPTDAELSGAAGATAERIAAWLGSLQPSRPDGPRLAVIIGPAGSGKRRAALAWLHRQDRRDGDLYADLRLEVPVTPGWVLDRWLPALLGVQDTSADLAEQAVVYVGATDGKQLGVLLSGAVSAAQVRPLIPAGPALMVVTTRRLLSGLAMDGARFLHINAGTDGEEG